MLDAANREEQETRNPPLPRWFFVVQALALAVALAGQALPLPWSAVVTALGIVTVVAVGVRQVFHRRGYGLVGLDGPGSFPYMISLLIGVGVLVILAISLELPWLWLIAGADAAVTTLEMGRRYRKATGRG
ncbi:hypothetical protein GCM10022383_20100 [Microbacterium soli]|uniref:DUF308 domain-containing protein n=2 Tax=Microbacterium soli TaxID=446075 RepID=A0ABP7NES4_9MICO